MALLLHLQVQMNITICVAGRYSNQQQLEEAVIFVRHYSIKSFNEGAKNASMRHLVWETVQSTNARGRGERGAALSQATLLFQQTALFSSSVSVLSCTYGLNTPPQTSC